MQHCTKNEVFHYGFFSKCDQIRSLLRILVTITEEFRDGKLHFLCIANILRNIIFQQGNRDHISVTISCHK